MEWFDGSECERIDESLWKNTSCVRVLDFFLAFPGFDHSEKEVAGETGVARLTVDKTWKHLVAEGFIARTRLISRAEMHQFNKKTAREGAAGNGLQALAGLR